MNFDFDYKWMREMGVMSVWILYFYWRCMCVVVVLICLGMGWGVMIFWIGNVFEKVKRNLL